ncbi:MAG: SUMF1/EgtB/PvdO family nonheme iron enzyme [Alphaproteobacteria bacterium]|nr:SUMF1/EgtB/PvdO family nonheme iron enzyme [Alphaproteobacteria bacterium]MCB9797491.1 SUMF1/EgtB/PvdO family nonheme iron enzyme [Alphaproteobacteria bacterium]
MGEVRRVWDQQTERDVAMKIIHKDLATSALNVQRFMHEVKSIVQLEHPGIVPLYDRGFLDDGRPWYTMREIKGGRTLQDLMTEEAHESGPEGHHPEPALRRLLRLLTVLRDASEAVAYAHKKQVLHRDLAPKNIMIDEEGRACVIDWGLARLLEAEEGDAPRPSPRPRLGTPGYRPPEQEGRPEGEHGPASDVHALGAILHHLLHGRLPTQVKAPSASGEREKPREIPPPLVELAARALSPDPTARPANAASFAKELNAWLAQEERRTLLQRADQLLKQLTDLESAVFKQRSLAAELLDGVPPHADVSRKLPGWDAEGVARELEFQIFERSLEREATLRALLSLDPSQTDAREHLIHHHERLLLSAERHGDLRELKRAEMQLRELGVSEDELARGGSVSVTTDSPGARIKLLRQTRHHRRIVEGDLLLETSDAVVQLTLEPGGYILDVCAPDRESVRCPLFVERAGSQDDVQRLDLRLPRIGTLGQDDILIPAGWFIAGGDPEAPDGLPRRKVWLDDFIIRRFPVTCMEYLQFLNALVEAGCEDVALWLAPAEGELSEIPMPVFRRGRDGLYGLGAASNGVQWEADWPITRIHWFGAMSFALWQGRGWRLPTDLEWEKAARGVDGRHFPWGGYLDPTWTRMLESRATAPRVERNQTFPDDVSSYGVRGMGGNVRDWCLNTYNRLGTSDRVITGPDGVADLDSHRLVKGGSWSSSPSYCRSAARFAMKPGRRLSSVGFRLARSFHS